ncbi:hypothetical protein A3842_04230 [Paenibacillus sp. P3E]|uniref:DUF4085 family protein n=1 Tax=Paenibacillus sp. P3E TaxID=1349435 RepID=UPI000939D31E|nr:DUF4085 family protein [Paenibacillus sp. P3E]OKP89300.1 hypothetical protein A3842_04230 [Paenibacillus sp. P3E]
MKYFTREWYEEMQVSGFLVFHETEEDWEQDVAWYNSEGLDFEEIRRYDLENRKNDLLKFLPESFHPYIQDGTINSRFPSDKLRTMTEQWRMEYDRRMSIIGNEYRNYYLSIKDSLPENVVQLYENSLHDAKVTSLEIPSENILIMTLDCRGSYYYQTDIKVTFTGVKSLELQDLSVGSYWLYNEVYSNEAGFQLNVLFDGPLVEFTLTADNVIIEISS